ncbi:hypothetical protein, partial [Amycolatopsis pigmentata]
MAISGRGGLGHLARMLDRRPPAAVGLTEQEIVRVTCAGAGRALGDGVRWISRSGGVFAARCGRHAGFRSTPGFGTRHHRHRTRDLPGAHPRRRREQHPHPPTADIPRSRHLVATANATTGHAIGHPMTGTGRSPRPAPGLLLLMAMRPTVNLFTGLRQFTGLAPRTDRAFPAMFPVLTFLDLLACLGLPALPGSALVLPTLLPGLDLLALLADLAWLTSLPYLDMLALLADLDMLALLADLVLLVLLPGLGLLVLMPGFQGLNRLLLGLVKRKERLVPLRHLPRIRRRRLTPLPTTTMLTTVLTAAMLTQPRQLPPTRHI